MKLPSFKRLNKQDYKEEDRELVDKLSNSLNIGLETLYTLADHRISLGDNTASVLKTFEIKVDATGKPVSGITNVSFGTTITSTIGVQVIEARNVDNPSVYVTSAPFISFTRNGTSIDINNIAGLPANNTFSLTIVIWG